MGSCPQALAIAVGAHPLAWFGAALLAVVGLVGALSALWQRRLWPGLRNRLQPYGASALMLAVLLIGLLMAAGGGALIAELVEAIDPGAGGRRCVGVLDQALTGQLQQSLSLSTLQLFGLLTHLGDTLTLTVICVVSALWLLRGGWRDLALALPLAGAGGGLLVRLLKSSFERARPLHEHGIAVVAQGFSFPSGHSAGSTVVYGMLAYALMRLAPRWRTPLAMAAAALVFTIGCSRVLLQVHWASDVLAGFVTGIAWLALCVAACEMGRLRAGKSGSVRGM